MIPRFNPFTGNLPPGIHEATWEDMVARFGYTPHRLRLLAGLKAALDALRLVSCRRAYVDGSFVSNKEAPRDFDGCWETANVDVSLLDPVLLVLTDRRAAQKAKFGGELFPADAVADVIGTYYVDFFQSEADGRRKGIIAIDLEELP